MQKRKREGNDQFVVVSEHYCPVLDHYSTYLSQSIQCWSVVYCMYCIEVKIAMCDTLK